MDTESFQKGIIVSSKCDFFKNRKAQNKFSNLYKNIMYNVFYDSTILGWNHPRVFYWYLLKWGMQAETI